MKENNYLKLKREVFSAYSKKFPRSRSMYARAQKSFLGGVSGSSGFWQPFPLYFTHGKGSKIFDVDGNTFLDCRNAYGAGLLGHAHPEIEKNVKDELDRGLLIHNSELGIEAAELLKEFVPCAGRVRFRNTGTETVMAALAVARAFSGRDKIIKFYGAYHGVAPEVMVGWSSHTAEITSGGIPREFMANTVVLPWNDIEVVRNKLKEDKNIGVVITDIISFNGGVFPPEGDFLLELRQLTEEYGVILIFDEVITGFRLAMGGAQEFFNVVPDLACYAKALAGGTPLGALVGREDVMRVLGGTESHASASVFDCSSRHVFQSGTMNDNTAGAAGVISSLKILESLNKKGEYKKLNSLTERFSRKIESLFRKRGFGCYVNNIGSCLKIHFTDKEPTYDLVCTLDKRISYLFAIALMTEGVLLGAPGLGGIFLSFAHNDDDVDRIITAINNVLGKYKFEGLLN